MLNQPPSLYVCPICQSSLDAMDKTWRCAQNHSFDVARQGYVNLLPAQFKKSKNPGDAASMVRARQHFLSAGHYAPLQAALVRALSEVVKDKATSTLLDVGCGEGYYTQALAQVVAQTTAVDISKAAVQATAKLGCANTTPLVASAVKLPLASGSVDVAASIFAPIIPIELSRVLKSGGTLIIAKPSPEHLVELRKLLFDKVRLHDSNKFVGELAPFFTLQKTEQVRFGCQLNNAELNSLLDMTPYAYRAKPEKRHMAASLEYLSVTADFAVYMFAKCA